jgi:uncharacterized protein (TIGR03437 family)
MRPISRSLVLLAVAGCALAQPLIYQKGVVNAASLMAADLPGGAIAQGSIFSIYGSNLGPSQGVTVNAFPLQTSLQGVSIQVFQEKTSVDALPIYVSATQINAIMPSNAPLGRVSVQVTYAGANVPCFGPGSSPCFGPTSNPAPLTVVPNSFGIFAVNGGGFGPGILQNFISTTSQPINSTAQTAAPGQVVTLWGTGLGPITGPDNVAPAAASLPVRAELLVGGKSASVAYSGRTPCCSGVDQIVFTVPQDAPPGCFVPVQMRVAGQAVSNAVTMAIQNGGGACFDPKNPLVQKFLSGGNLGGIFATRVNSLLDQFVASPVNVLVDSLSATLWKETGAPFAFDPAYALPPEGTCTVYALAGDLLVDASLPGRAPTGKALAGGSPLIVSGAAGSASVPARSLVYASVLGSNVPGSPTPNLFFNPGAFSVLSMGGAEVGPFRANFTATAPVNWTNQTQLVQINRSQGLTFSWTGGDAERETVLLEGVSMDTPTHSSAAFLCAISPSAGRFTVPAYVLANLPATRSTEILPKAWLLLGSIPINGTTPFSAQGLDTGFSVFGAWNAKSVAFQ